ncbi:ABC transporter ATP-binding protein [Phaeobacter inhibens]|uniref:ABC transporter ATP-binding protein n=1 Tax=Phaeobacter inhibens TaxID=221822 RepID=UPI00040FF343|nr:ATP-binding cassette domain-containing protein [Phaeobacter inhibens]AUQ62745.1 amino acid/amide ABC transporter ATP-binding protein 1, HAAT family [Phaeobacter inhibens]AUQ70599.1 amino acid/amide ABC transporter ATP-binding protein 1, HAAT family [Phaeobacter inhibens]AUQ82648.1 amino acid/amide ABC transporter ATP-binding protein 1, HAAT family [Phaeobacter inhibens]AUQ90409.1 amino acid/amide ABC transporter ATP-binding protein 1, HAAT family [Phaeobacter inhibens]AUR07935.1 amino acid/
MLEARNLSKAFGGLRVIEDVSVTVAPGNCLGIMGGNGAGKSTFFDLLTDVTRAAGGSVHVAGRDVTGLDTAGRVRAGLARAFQVPRAFASLSVQETLYLAQHASHGIAPRAARARVEEILEITGLGPHSNSPGTALRLLDRKRLELAKALASDPKVILLDEVSGGLTDQETAEMVLLVKRLKEAGLAVLWIEHIAHALQEASDRIMMLALGRKLMEDRPEVVAADPQVRALYLGAAA